MRFANNVLTTLNVAMNVGDTSMVVNAASAPYASPPNPAGSIAPLTLVDSLTTPTKIETITYTGRTGTGPYTLTGVTRSQSVSWPAGTRVFQAPRAEDMFTDDLPSKATLNSNDLVPLLDSQDSFKLKRATFGALLELNTTNPIAAGVVAFFASTSAPSGWLVCNGALVSKTTYANLFAVLGTTFGAGNATQFNLPDLRGQFIRGYDNSVGTDPDYLTRAFGSVQAHALRKHFHYSGYAAAQTNGSNGSPKGMATETQATGYKSSGPFSIEDSTYIGASETRPVNIALLPMIKF